MNKSLLHIDRLKMIKKIHFVNASNYEIHFEVTQVYCVLFNLNVRNYGRMTLHKYAGSSVITDIERFIVRAEIYIHQWMNIMKEFLSL